MTKKEKNSTGKVKASHLFMGCRFAALPEGMVTMEQFRKLKAGESLTLSLTAENKKYFIKDGE